MSLRLLAEYLRDGTWLDIRTDEGPIQRVRIFEIVVRLAGEDVTLLQQWFDEDDAFQKRYFAIDAEAIWKAMPTSCELGEVIPHGLPRPFEPMGDEATVRVTAEVLKATCFLYGLGLEELRNTRWAGVGDKHIDARHVTIVVLYETTDLSPVACSEALGYKSAMPWQTASRKTSGPHQQEGFREAVKRLGNLVDSRLDGRYRRTRPLPRDYRPVLA